ncbi:hypothetical protein NIES2100_04890 [Calothrix sp. NIES-2100]|uniref:hypothetical protein n=1 Tax=Calothrix sp. NIES-2100 TaxID=1954172 RepID=UPI000B5EE1C0|nr:hypothetical protein NIES2100_04890 [Calothrix sp. NIES-2100]
MPKTKMLQCIYDKSIKDIATIQGKGFSDRTLRRLIANNELRQGYHYIRTGTGILKFNLDRFNEYLSGIQ